MDAMNLRMWGRCQGSSGVSAWLFAVVFPFCPSLALSQAMPGPQDNAEVKRLHDEDQADRKAFKIDWSVVDQRDRARGAHVKELYETNQLKTGNDYYSAALILQHATTAEDHLLAHELCVVAVSRGIQKAKWLAAASEDRFLMTIGRPQRFGTQFQSVAGGPVQLYEIEAGVTDELRRLMDVRALQEAKEEIEEITERHSLTPEQRLEKWEGRAKENPKDVKALIKLADLYRQLNRPTEELETHLKALALDPKLTRVRVNVACHYAGRGEKKEALDALEVALKNGYDNREWLQSADCLKSVRGEPRYAELLRRYLPPASN